MNGGALDIQHVPHTMPCGRCGTPGVLGFTQVLEEYATADGLARLVREHVLCEHCDIDCPAGGPLLTFMAVHAPIDGVLAADLATYMRRWIDKVSAEPDPAIFEAEWEAWRRGDFDL